MAKITPKSRRLPYLPEKFKQTSWRLNYGTIGGIRTLTRVAKLSSAVGAVQFAVQLAVSHLPEIFPMTTKEEIGRIMREELQMLEKGHYPLETSKSRRRI